MKNVQFPILALSAILLISSCKKDDFQEESATNDANIEAITNAADTVGWKSTAKWETADQETFSVHYITIEDAGITADVADDGLVLLYKKNDKAINSLPFEENLAKSEATESGDEENTNANYWYHQVTEGNLLISCDVYANSKAPETANRFKYFIITPEKLQSLTADGHTTEELMGLSYAEAAALLEGSK